MPRPKLGFWKLFGVALTVEFVLPMLLASLFCFADPFLGYWLVTAVGGAMGFPALGVLALMLLRSRREVPGRVVAVSFVFGLVLWLVAMSLPSDLRHPGIPLGFHVITVVVNLLSVVWQARMMERLPEAPARVIA